MFGNLRRADHDGVKVSRWGDPWKVARVSDQGGQDSVKRRHSRSRLPIGGRLLLVGAVTLAALVATMSAASAASNQWKLGSYTANGGFAFKSAPLGTFNFPTVPAQCSPAPGCEGNTGQGAALLLNNTGTLVGNLTGKSITATFTISGVSPTAAFTYGGEPDGSGIAANVRLYFDSASITKSKNLVATNYWWSNPESVTLVTNGTGFTLTATIAPANWSDYYGAFGNADPSTTSAFNAAASNVKDIGFSFGGGYFFSNGVGTTDGSGAFTVTSFSVS
jgi:hypothetical protein